MKKLSIIYKILFSFGDSMEFMIKSKLKPPCIFDSIGKMTRPRIIKTHLNYELLPKGVREKNVKV